MLVLKQRKMIFSSRISCKSSASSPTLPIIRNWPSNNCMLVSTRPVRTEDAYELATTWTVNQASLVLQKIVSGLKSRELAHLTSSFVITMPFNYNSFRDVVKQFERRLPSHPPAVHAITALKCYKCQGPHLVKECPVVKCFKCSGPHKTSLCKVKQDKLNCARCNLSNHTTAGHFEFPGKNTPRAQNGEETGVFTCFSTGTSFVDGAVYICNGGKNSFINSKLLVDTCLLYTSPSPRD